MDPLSALRDYAIRGELNKVVRVGDEFRFASEYSFPCSAETCYRSKQGNLYTLESLVFFLQNQNVRHTDYIHSAGQRRIPAVTFPDRKPLLDYLLGRVNFSDSIIPLIPPNPSSNIPPPPDLNLNEPGSEPESEREIDFVAKMRDLERPLKDREALLEARGNRDFYSVLMASTRREEERQRVEQQQRKDGLVAKTRLTGAADEHHRHDSDAPKPKILKGGGEGVPIIIVPSASQTLITIYNVKEFLEDGVFVPSEEKEKEKKIKGEKRPDCITVQKKFSRDRDRVVTAYEVRDKPSVFKPEDWDRVVAVFVLGKEWQFKDWPFKDHVEIFNKFIGFYVRFEDDSIEAAKVVKQWNVKIISISKNKRHQDRAAALEVWDRLEGFMRSRSHS